MELKLAAILAAKVVGLDRLLQEHEQATLAALQAHHHRLIDRAIAMHRGRIVELRLDQTLATFEVVVDAMECALEIQRGMARRNRGLAPEQWILLRTGLDHRDVMADRGDLRGHGVDVACFLRDLVPPGGLCISDNVYLQVRERVAADYEGLGVHAVAGLAQPVRAIRAIPRQSAGSWWPWRRGA
jgi:class 3 adenylate cyclase